MNAMVAIRAKRILSHLTNFRFLEASEAIEGLVLLSDETFIGIYGNEAASMNESIVITYLGLHIFIEKQWKFLRYDCMSAVQTPENKVTIEGLSITLERDKSFSYQSVVEREGSETFFPCYDFSIAF